MGRARAVLVCLLFSLAGCSCGDDEAPKCDPEACPAGYECSIAGPCMPMGSCLDARDCEPGQSCTMDGECTFQPTEDERCPDSMECREGEICSEEGWCIADGTCGTDADCEDSGDQCSPGHVCLPDGACSMNSECPEGTECVDGDCLPGGDCGETEYGIDNPPNLLILLDRSGSMDEEIDGRSKWEIAVEAITSTIGAWDTSIRFGLALFSDCDNCEPGSIFVDCASDSADDVIATLGAEPRCPTTPIGASLNAMLGQATIQDDTRQNAILLVTDGQDTCEGDPSAEAAALLAQAISVPTYVVGFGSGVDAGELQATAQAGGTTDYYQADSADGLESALSAISGRLLGCTYPLSEAPPDPALLYVFFNNQSDPIPRSASNGWEYDEVTNSIVFTGSYCEQITNGDVRDIDIVYGCPEPII